MQIVDWISHSNLPEYYNKLKLLVLPSYTEGLPNVVIEAMACGTPVLVTSVGAIPDIVTDGVTGFILENTSPEHIAENIVRALNHPDLEKITLNAKRFIDENYVYEATTRKFKNVFDDLVEADMRVQNDSVVKTNSCVLMALMEWLVTRTSLKELKHEFSF